MKKSEISRLSSHSRYLRESALKMEIFGHVSFISFRVHVSTLLPMHHNRDFPLGILICAQWVYH